MAGGRRHVAMGADHAMAADHAMVTREVMARRHDVVVVMVADRLG
jgi:hypothetical protein